MSRTFQLSYYPWITQHVDPREVRRAVEQFAAAVQRELAKELADAAVRVPDPIEVPRQIELVTTQDRHVALMNPLGYVFAREASAAVEPAAVARRVIDGKEGVTYYAQLYADVKSGITGVPQTRRRSVGYGVPYSTSNFLVPALMLKQGGVHPFFGFSRVEFLGGHDLVAKAVYVGRVEIGAGHDGVIHDLARQPGYEDAEKRLKMFARSDPIPSDPVAVHIADQGEQGAVQKALLAAAKSKDGKEAIARFWGDARGLDATDAKAYGILAAAVQKLKVTAEDLLAS
jgi:ABC-type phosphate/phosphonate transport system substrate-binding protein